jgi:hypothetical protein
MDAATACCGSSGCGSNSDAKGFGSSAYAAHVHRWLVLRWVIERRPGHLIFPSPSCVRKGYEKVPGNIGGQHLERVAPGGEPGGRLLQSEHAASAVEFGAARGNRSSPKKNRRSNGNL